MGRMSSTASTSPLIGSRPIVIGFWYGFSGRSVDLAATLIKHLFRDTVADGRQTQLHDAHSFLLLIRDSFYTDKTILPVFAKNGKRFDKENGKNIPAIRWNASC
jgi:hypothetical protein